MNKVLHKLSFVFAITNGLPSIARLLWHSKLLRWSKTGFVKVGSPTAQTAITIRHPLGSRLVNLRTYAGDIDIFYEIFFKKIYALPVAHSTSINTIVDLGANVGLSALYFLQQFPQAQVVCVEPEPTNFKMLELNLETEITTGKVIAMEAAAMGEDGMVSFESAPAKYNGRVILGAQNNIPALSIPSIMQRCQFDRINLLKIDVEGAEKFIFSGDPVWLQSVDEILLEVHSPEDHATCMAAFERYHFKLEALDADAANQNLFWASRSR